MREGKRRKEKGGMREEEGGRRGAPTPRTPGGQQIHALMWGQGGPHAGQQICKLIGAQGAHRHFLFLLFPLARW